MLAERGAAAMAADVRTRGQQRWPHANSVRAAAALAVGPLVATAAEGALPVLRAAVDPGVRGGEFYGPDGFHGIKGSPHKVQPAAAAEDTAVSGMLWRNVNSSPACAVHCRNSHFPVKAPIAIPRTAALYRNDRIECHTTA
jgi:hypothetical protein